MSRAPPRQRDSRSGGNALVSRYIRNPQSITAPRGLLKLSLLLSALIVTISLGCGGSGDHHEARDADTDAEVRVAPAGPPRFARGAIVVGEDEEPVWNRECAEPGHLCPGDKDACRAGQADNPEDVTDPLETWSRGRGSGDPADVSAEKAKELTVAGAGIWNSIWNAVSVSGTKGVDLSAYNSVVDYRIRFECENEDGSSDVYDQAGSLDPRFGVKSCELRAGAFSSRSVRLIVERSNGQRIWQVRMKMSPTTGKTVSTDDAIADSRSGTSVSIPLEDGTLRLNAAFFSTGWSKIGAAGNRNQGALYLTYDKSHWMKDMPNAFKKMPLVKWTLPGSHDAGMYTHDGGADNLAMTQTQNVQAIFGTVVATNISGSGTVTMSDATPPPPGFVEVWPDDAEIWLCPCLNPTGFPRNTRENAGGVDLNRDYKHRRSAEVRAHIAWLQRQPNFDLIQMQA